MIRSECKALFIAINFSARSYILAENTKKLCDLVKTNYFKIFYRIPACTVFCGNCFDYSLSDLIENFILEEERFSRIKF